MTTTASNPSHQIAKIDCSASIHGTLQVAVITTGTAIAALLVFAHDARLALLAPPGIATAGLVIVFASAVACAPSAWRHRRITPTVVGHWFLWTAPAVAWTLIGRYPIVDATNVLILACAAGVPTALSVALLALDGSEA